MSKPPPGLGLLALLFATAPAAAVDLVFPALPAPAPAITLDGSISAAEWAGSAAVNRATGLEGLLAGSVEVRTARDDKYLYLAFDVPDASDPTRATRPDRVVVAFWLPGAAMPNKAYAVDVAVRPIVKVSSYEGTVGIDGKLAVDGWSGPTDVPDNDPNIAAKVAPNLNGYGVEVRVSLAKLGLALPLPRVPPTLRILAAVFDCGQLPSDRYDYLQNPNQAVLPFGVARPVSVLEYLSLSPEHRDTSRWAVGQLSGDLAGFGIYLDREPVSWLAYRSLRPAFCTPAGNTFDTIGEPSSTNLKFYRYYRDGPCKMRIWVRAYRKGLPTEAVPKVRVLALYGEHGNNLPVDWSFAALGEATAVPSVPAVDPFGAGARNDFAPLPFDLTTVPPLASKRHPCLAVLLLPEALDAAGFGADWIRNIKPKPGGNPIGDLMKAYRIPDEQFAQYNLEVVDGGNPHPACPPCEEGGGGDILRIAQAVAPERHPILAPYPQPVAKFDVVAFLHVKGFNDPVAGGEDKMDLAHTLGGVAKLIPRAVAEKGQDLPLNFRVVNPHPVPRRILVVPQLQVPAGLPKLRVEIKQPEGEFKPGEAREVEVVLTARPGSGGTPTTPCPCPPAPLPPCPMPCPPVSHQPLTCPLPPPPVTIYYAPRVILPISPCPPPVPSYPLSRPVQLTPYYVPTPIIYRR